jgi:hypothetical protein
MIPLSNLLVYVQGRWALNASLPALVPGGLWHKRVNEDTTAPYATISVTAENVQMIATGDYLCGVAVTITVWSTAQIGGTTLRDIQLAVSSVMSSLAGSVALESCRLLGLIPDAAIIELDDIPRNSEDVILIQTTYRGMIYGSAS